VAAQIQGHVVQIREDRVDRGQGIGEAAREVHTDPVVHMVHLDPQRGMGAQMSPVFQVGTLHGNDLGGHSCQES